jgi:hypothetical protein
MSDDIAIGHDDQRRPHMGLQDADRFSRLDDEGFVFAHRLQRGDDRVMGGPIPRRLSQRGVNDEIVRVFADAQDIFQEAQQPLLISLVRARRGRPE